MTLPAWVRPSNLPRLAACPASGITSEGQLSPGSDAAALGTAFHELAAAWACGLEVDIEACARAHAVAAEALRPLADALAAYSFDPSIRREAELATLSKLAEGIEVAGRADLVLHHDGGWVEVVDVKTGNPDYADDGAFTQLAAYGIGIADQYGHATMRLSLWYAQLGAGGWWHRDVEVEPERERLRGIVERALAQVERSPEKRSYRVGDACTFCPGRVVCPARLGEARAFASALTEQPTAVLTADNIGAFDARLRQVEKLVDAAKDARREYVSANGGRVVIGDGYALELRTEQRKAYTVEAGERTTLRRVKA